MKQQRELAEQLLCGHVAGRRGVDLAVDGERQLARQSLHGNSPCGPLRVVQQRSRLQHRRKVQIGRPVPRVDVHAADKQIAIPRRDRQDKTERRGRWQQTCEAAGARPDRPDDNERRDRGEQHRRPADRVLEAGQRNRDETGEQRAGHGSHRIHRVDGPDESGRRTIAAPDEFERQWKRNPECDGERHKKDRRVH